MANVVGGVRWRIDTLPFSYAFRVYIVSIEWSEQTAVTDQLVIKEINGNFILDTLAYAVNFLQNYPKQGWVNGVNVTTLTHGVLFINVGGAK